MAQTKQQPDTNPKPRAMRLALAAKYSGLSRASLYRRWQAGEVEFIKAGSATLVDVESLDRLLASLPRLEPRARPQQAA